MKTTTLLMTALLVCFTSTTVLANNHRSDNGKRDKQKFERKGVITVTTKHYKSTYQREQPPNHRWVKKQRQERHRDYLAQQQKRQHTRWANRSPRDRYDERRHNKYRQHMSYQGHNVRRQQQVDRIVIPYPPIPRVVLTFPW